MQEEALQYNQQIKAREKDELLNALAILALRTRQNWTLTRYSYTQILQFALSEKADDSVKIISDLHRQGRLTGLIKTMQDENKLPIEISLPKHEKVTITKALVDDLVKLATEPNHTKQLNSKSNYSSVATPHSIFHHIPESKASPNMLMAGGIGAVVGAGLLMGGIITAMTLITKSVAAMAVVATAAAAGTAFPPLGIGLVVAGTILLAAMAIFLVCLAFRDLANCPPFELRSPNSH